MLARGREESETAALVVPYMILVTRNAVVATYPTTSSACQGASFFTALILSTQCLLKGSMPRQNFLDHGEFKAKLSLQVRPNCLVAVRMQRIFTSFLAQNVPLNREQSLHDKFFVTSLLSEGSRIFFQGLPVAKIIVNANQLSFPTKKDCLELLPHLF